MLPFSVVLCFTVAGNQHDDYHTTLGASNEWQCYRYPTEGRPYGYRRALISKISCSPVPSPPGFAYLSPTDR